MGTITSYTKARLDTLLGLKLDTAARGAANGVAPLGADNKVPAANLPTATATAAAFSGVRLRRSTAQSVPNTTDVIVSFDVEDYDTSGYHDPATNPSRITVPTTGYYRVWYYVQFPLNATGGRIAQVKVNNTGAPVVVTQQAGSNGFNNEMSGAVDIRLTAGDYIELGVYQNSGGALNLTSVAGAAPAFGATFLGS